MRYFCTYFDNNYGALGLALYESLRRNCPEFTLWILCLDRPCHDALARLDLPGVRLISLEEFERDDAPLRAAKENRNRIEYYFTCTASLPLYILQRNPAVDLITYLDSDLFFFSSPEPLFAEIGRNSVAIIPHRFSPARRELEVNGLYNVGWLTFRADPNGRACLNWWRERCLEWCYQRNENGRYADQKYLDDWPDRFPGVVVLQHKGANVALWNLGNYRLSALPDGIRVDGEPMIFFHFHGLRRPRPWFFKLSASYYGISVDRLIARRIFVPYLQLLLRDERRGAKPFPAYAGGSEPLPALTRWPRFLVHVAAEFFRGNYLLAIGGHIFARP